MEIKDKPKSMSVRDWIIKKIAIGIKIPENIVRQVEAHHFDSALGAIDKYNSIEISGFGKFFYNPTKAKKELEKYRSTKTSIEKKLNSEKTTGKKRQSLEEDLKIINQVIKYIESKQEWEKLKK